jgi:hypothetical protein
MREKDAFIVRRSCHLDVHASARVSYMNFESNQRLWKETYDFVYDESR